MEPSAYAFTWSKSGRQSRAMDVRVGARRASLTRDVNITTRLQDGRMVSVWLTPDQWQTLLSEAGA